MHAFFGSFDLRRLARALALAAFAVVVFAFVVAGCGRTSLEPEVLDAGTDAAPPACGAATCPNGCCDANGVCQAGNDIRACGSVGERCSDCISSGFSMCTSSHVCGRIDPICNGSSCASGCCAVDTSGRTLCLSGTEPSACGSGGDQCVSCAGSGRVCDASTRTCGASKCDSTNCSGCCVGDQCVTGTSVAACGSGGGQCATCASTDQCIAGVCQGTTDNCGPSNCGGCCDTTGVCVSGTQDTACGAKGQLCSACGVGSSCVGQGGVVGGMCMPSTGCGPENCDGCCAGSTCVTNQTALACGIKGEACKTCATSETCNAVGQCVATGACNAANCPSGCCVGDICAIGSQDTACGTAGALCQNCASLGETCKAGKCEAQPCGPANCPNGCCSGNKCVSGTDDTACGKAGGGACSDCTASGEKCQNQTCTAGCGPSNCSGCCKADGTCDPLGIDNNSCGQGGAACTNCLFSGSFCDGLVSPRQCANQQTTCPAPYSFCSPNTSLPVTPSLQKVCTNANLDTLATACSGGADTASCQAAVAALPSACKGCIQGFDVPFEQKTGLYACAASFVGNNCRRALGCASECLTTSCDQCPGTTQSQCSGIVSSPPIGQCAPYTGAANCANIALTSGVCSQFSYPSFGAWLRGVGDHFCGDGP